MSLLGQSAVFLGAAVCAVPIARRLGLGSVLGYLAAGIVIGPFGLGLIDGVENVLHFAELGVVLLLFVIGLELQPSRLWALRRTVFGTGALQVLGTGVVIAVAAAASGLPLAAAIVVGLTLALSSTAFALQSLAEKGQLTTRHGRGAFAILLFQDLAVVPLIALVPLLGPREDTGDPWLAAVKIVAVLAATLVAGHYLLGHAFRWVASTRIREVFTALALLVVIGIALLMELVGLSMALGAFLAGMLLADSEFRHAIEADLEPFKGLLLGLFFIAVGMSVDLGLAASQPLQVAALALGLVAVKFALLFGTGMGSGFGRATSLRLAASIAQGGEFAFVIFGVAVADRVIEAQLADRLILVVTVSMALTPLVDRLVEHVLARGNPPTPREFDRPPDEVNPVIIAGFGRFGQIVGRILRAKRIGFTALDASPEHVDFVRRYGNDIYYGDASNLDLLRAAKADRARILVLALDDEEASLRTAAVVREHFPHLKIHARARNRKHAYRLMDTGITSFRRETFGSSLELAQSVLEDLDLPRKQAARLIRTFRAHDIRRLHDAHQSHDDEARMRYLAIQSANELETMFEEDEADQDLHD